MTHIKTSVPIAQWPLELRLLALLVQRPDARLVDEVDQLLAHGTCDAARFRKLVMRHRVESTVAHNLGQFAKNGPTADIAAVFKGRAGFLAKRLMVQEKMTAEVSRSLTQKAIPHLLLKGAAVAGRYYANRYDRQYKDLDFLIAPDDIEKALAVVQGLGYEITVPGFALTPKRLNALRFMDCDITLTRASDQIQIELHWRVETNPMMLDWELPSLSRQTVEINVAGQAVPVLDTAAQFVYLCCHGAKHSWFRLRWLADISRLLQVISPEELDRALILAEDTGTQRMVAVGLHLAQGICSAKLGAKGQEFLARHIHPQSVAFALRSMTTQDGRTHIRWRDMGFIWRRFIYHLTLKPSLPYKMSIVYRALLDPRDIGVLGLPARWAAVYCLCAPVLAVLRVIRRGV